MSRHEQHTGIIVTATADAYVVKKIPGRVKRRTRAGKPPMRRGVQILVWVTEVGLIVGIPATIITIITIVVTAGRP